MSSRHTCPDLVDHIGQTAIRQSKSADQIPTQFTIIEPQPEIKKAEPYRLCLHFAGSTSYIGIFVTTTFGCCPSKAPTPPPAH